MGTTYTLSLSTDYVGMILALGFASSLLPALQLGGSEKPWDDKAAIATLVVAGVLLTMFGF